MDVIGLALAGAETDFGRSVRDAALAISTPGPCRILGFGDRVGVTTAAFANGAFSQALEFDDTHNESIVHMSSPAVAAALALSEFTAVSGRDLITAIAIGNEISCRVGSVSSGELHERGFHPTGLFATFGAAYLAGKLLGLDAEAHWRARRASPEASRRDCWNAGWMERRPSFCIQDGRRKAESRRRCWRARASRDRPKSSKDAGDFSLRTCRIRTRIATSRASMTGSGEHWESRNSSFKPFPAAHVIHPYISAVLRLRAKHGIQPGDVERIECPVTAFIVGIVCEPTEEKFAPASDSHGRVSLQYSLAEALYHRGARQNRLQRGESQESGDPRARAPRALSRRSGLSRPRPLQGRGQDHTQRRPRRSKRWKNTIEARPRIR